MLQMDLLQKELMSALQDAKAASSKNPDVSPDDEKSPKAFKTISEVSELLQVPQHVLRFWESRFPQIKPTKLKGGRRYYRPQDVQILATIQHLLYKQGYTIKGARKAFGQMGKLGKSAPLPPVASAKVETPAKAQHVLTDRQHSQLSVIRQELIGMHEMLKAYV